MPLNPGDKLLNDHYRIDRLLGRGGFGFVYLAQDSLLHEQVAIKELIPGLLGDEGMLKRFLAEARATMHLRHERIVGTHNVFSERGNYYIVMECMAGGSLEARLGPTGILPVDQAIRMAAEIGEGLAYAHKRGIVHCDLKPANILFDNHGHAKVADFGIAHVSGEMLTRSWNTPAGFVAGTLPYMSPEQADGVRDDPRIDIYALGAVLYRTLTGQTYLAFDRAETPRAQMENLQRIYTQHPVVPSTINSRIPPWLDAVVLKALSKQPAARYGNCEQMLASLTPVEQPAPPQTPIPVQPVAPRQVSTPGPVAPLQRPPGHEARPGPARSRPQAPAASPAVRSAPPVARAPVAGPARASTPARIDSRPAWLRPAARVAVVLFLILVIAIIALTRNGGEKEQVAGPEVSPTAAVTRPAVLQPTIPPQTVANDLLEQVLDAGQLVVSTDPNYPPQSFINDTGSLDGFDVDVAFQVAERLGVDVIFVTPDWDLMTAGNWGRRWDVSIGSMTPTPARAEVLWFTDPYYYSLALFAVHQDNTSIRDIAGLSGKTIGLDAGTICQAYLNGSPSTLGVEIAYPPPADITVQPYTAYYGEAIDDLAVGDGVRLDAVLSDQQLIQSKIDEGRPLKFVGTPAFYESLVFALDRARGPADKMLARLNEILAEMHSDGTLSELSIKWYGFDRTQVLRSE